MKPTYRILINIGNKTYTYPNEMPLPRIKEKIYVTDINDVACTGIVYDIIYYAPYNNIAGRSIQILANKYDG
jgi:hypothetical protein